MLENISMILSAKKRFIRGAEKLLTIKEKMDKLTLLFTENTFIK